MIVFFHYNETVGIQYPTTEQHSMTLKRTIYDSLPDPVKPIARRGYQQITGQSQVPDNKLHSEFVENIFDSQDEYEEYITEFKQGSGVSLRNEAFEKYQQMTGREGMGGIGLDIAQDYYAVTRKVEPKTIIETGVCNGVSTLALLLAIRENEQGKLYSIDYPLRADESLEEFRQETFQDYGGAAIPSDKDPGWIIPTELRSQWDLTIGKSQRELPQLVTELGSIDLFIHDSEHSHPCMMFEYELAYEWLTDSGLILSDDITWNDAFDIFTEVREPKYGKISNNVGYIKNIE